MSPEIIYKPSIAGRVARSILPTLHKVLPTALYGIAYRLAYDNYKRALFVGHAAKVVLRRPISNERAKLRDRLVIQLLPHTMGGRKALENAFNIVADIEDKGVPGCLVECGVAEGGTAAMMGMTNRALGTVNRVKWFFDSYEGLPEPTAEDYHDGRAGEFIRPLPKGSCLGTLEQVSGLLFSELRFEPEQTNLVKGWFQDTVPPRAGKLGPIAVLRLDGDWYESTKIPLDAFYDDVSPGGYVIVDDYATCYGSRKAVDEFRTEQKITTPLQQDGRGGIYFIKPQT